jgi:glycosyltransferase involved in cell wall biosynthesis
LKVYIGIGTTDTSNTTRTLQKKAENLRYFRLYNPTKQSKCIHKTLSHDYVGVHFSPKLDNILVNKVKFVGQLYDDDKWAAFYGCEAFILPSHQENFAISVVEALACSKLVLISNKINIYDEVRYYNAGFIENDTLLGTYNNLISFLSLDYKIIQIMNNNAYKLFREKFNINLNAINFIKAIS